VPVRPSHVLNGPAPRLPDVCRAKKGAVWLDAMSATGQRTTSACRRGVSALAPRAEMPVAGSFAPEAASRDSAQTITCFSEVEIARQMAHVQKVA
jgi:hypothetical protein